MSQSVINDIEDSIRGGKTGIVLSWNTSDRFFLPDEDIHPTSLHLGLATYFGQRGYHSGLYSQATGLQALSPPGASAEGSNPFEGQQTRSLQEITPILRRRGESRSILLVQYADLVAPEADQSVFLHEDQQNVLETLHRWGTDDAIRQAQNLVVLITYEGEVNQLLTQTGAYRRIQVPLPDATSREQFTHLLQSAGNGSARQFASLEDGFTHGELARVSNGLRLTDLEALFRSRRSEEVSHEDIRQAKAETIREMAGGLVEIVQPTEGFESVVGLESVKEFFQFYKWAWKNGSAAIPSRMILAGVPGQGKSYICSRLAKELNMPELIIRNLHGPLVGQSEANMERVLQIVDSMSPCVVVIEELDQWGVGQRGTGTSGDNGTTQRMTQRFWEAMGTSASRGKNLWIATTNRPDLLDAAMLDRFQQVLPFLHPTPDEVEDLLAALARQLDRGLDEDVNLEEISHLPSLHLPTVRSLTEVIGAAATRADYEAQSIGADIDHRHLRQAALDYKPTYDRLQHEYIALRTVEMVSFTSQLPWMSGNGRRVGTTVPEYLRDVVDEETGQVNTNQLSERLKVLEEALHRQRMMR